MGEREGQPQEPDGASDEAEREAGAAIGRFGGSPPSPQKKSAPRRRRRRTGRGAGRDTREERSRGPDIRGRRADDVSRVSGPNPTPAPSHRASASRRGRCRLSRAAVVGTMRARPIGPIGTRSRRAVARATAGSRGKPRTEVGQVVTHNKNVRSGSVGSMRATRARARRSGGAAGSLAPAAGVPPELCESATSGCAELREWGLPALRVRRLFNLSPPPRASTLRASVSPLLSAFRARPFARQPRADQYLLADARILSSSSNSIAFSARPDAL